MWIYTPTSHLSIVETPEWDEEFQRDDVGRPFLSVRARNIKDLTSFAKVEEWEVSVDFRRDYPYRVFFDRDRVTDLLTDYTKNINYDNFKASIPINDSERLRWYSKIWAEGVLANEEKGLVAS